MLANHFVYVSLVSEVLLLVLPLNIFFAIYILGSVISKWDFIKFNALKIQIVYFIFSFDHSDLTFKAGWNDIPGMNQKTSLNLK
jgi:hypothetical protein